MKFYQVGGPLQEFFVSSDGKVYVRKRLDAESQQYYELKVKAFDGLHESIRPFILRIRVDDVNDNSPICHIPNRETEVLESSKNGTSLFYLNATDADILEVHSEISYSLLNAENDANDFEVDPKTGEVFLTWQLDYELKKEYSFRVEAKDSANHACHYDLKVQVLDFNDNAPIFDEPIKLSSVPENALVGSLVGKVHATDADLGTFTIFVMINSYKKPHEYNKSSLFNS
ncbi:unnamed protein product [Rodentolepis nana]|uniref:Cadherin domain-containing protein n=1 Tax=Rodentolepis nana TaxID=102285 RepID=A0A0R3TMR5_RODNA|nr:unnamed protein product [Rodentolepis nana]